MMHKNRLMIFGLVAVALIIAAALAVNKENTSVSNADAGKAVFPELKSQVNDVAQIELAQRDKTFHVVKNEQGWVIKEKNNYAADLSKIKQVILTMADLTTIEAKTKKADRYSVLGVEDVKADSTSSSIKLLDKDGKELAALIVGKQESSSLSGKGVDTVYVRRINDEQSWLAKGELRLDAKANQWINTKLFDVSPKRMQKVVLTGPDRKAVTIEKHDRSAQDFTLLGIPKNKTIESTSEVNAIADAISNIVIRDVESADNEKAPSFDKDVYHAEFIGFDGLVVDVDTVKLHGKHYAKYSAKYDAALRKEDKSEEASTADDKSKDAIKDDKDAKDKPTVPVMGHGASAKPAPLQTVEATTKEAEDLNGKFKGWIFEISSTKADSIRKAMTDLVKDKDKDKDKDKAKKS